MGRAVQFSTTLHAGPGNSKLLMIFSAVMATPFAALGRGWRGAHDHHGTPAELAARISVFLSSGNAR